MTIWDGFTDWKDVMTQFEGDEPEPDEVFLAWYGGGSYEGDAIVLYRKGDAYFLNEGGHCSCNGLEGQWGPERYENKQLFLECLGKRRWYDTDKAMQVGKVIGYLSA